MLKLIGFINYVKKIQKKFYFCNPYNNNKKPCIKQPQKGFKFQILI